MCSSYGLVCQVLIESDWNLKDTDIYLLANVECGINRIRLEFKVYSAAAYDEFNITVLIESDWNLKLDDLLETAEGILVLIESDWNLKHMKQRLQTSRKRVLIESDWNLKFTDKQIDALWKISINRIRLEFKGDNLNNR